MHLPFSRFFVSCRNLSPSAVLFNQRLLLELTVYVAISCELHYNSNHRWLFWSMSILRIASDARRIMKLILYHWKSRRVVLYRCITTATLSLNSRCFVLLSAFLWWLEFLSLSLAEPCLAILTSLTICWWIWDAIEIWDLLENLIVSQVNVFGWLVVRWLRFVWQCCLILLLLYFWLIDVSTNLKRCNYENHMRYEYLLYIYI